MHLSSFSSHSFKPLSLDKHTGTGPLWVGKRRAQGKGYSGISDKDRFFSVPHAFLDSAWVPSAGWAEVAGIVWRKKEHTRLKLA